MSRIESYQKTNNRKIASTQLDTTMYETMLRMAELLGHTTVSSFVKEAIYDKMSMTASSINGLINDRRALNVW